MVNPQKHKNNLNEEDMEYIYNRLNEKYEESTDKTSRNIINQQIIIFLLVCKRFSPQMLMKIPVQYFKNLNENDILYKPVNRHISNNYCRTDGLLLTDNGKEYTQEDIEKLLSNIDTGKIDKKVSINTLNKTKSRFNDYGRKSFNKQQFKKYMMIKNNKELNEVNMHKKEYNNEVNEKIDSLTQKLDSLDEIKEKQNILEDSILNKYNQVSKTLNKIHQNTKSTNNQYKQLNNNIKDLTKMEEKISEIISTKKENSKREHTPDEEIDIKQYTIQWLNKNIKVTKNPHDAMEIKKIWEKLEKQIKKEKIQINRKHLKERLESYLKVWYNTQESVNDFESIKNESINGKIIYSNLRFIDIKYERENKIKNSIIAWLKENTLEVKGTKTYTEDIYKRILPIFEENGWIITTPKEYKQLHEAGFTKVCIKRTFSQIIGKAVQEVYKSITKNTIQRDTPTNGYITWYPNIEIIDSKTSTQVQTRMKNELTDNIFQSENKIYDWLEENLTYTGNQEDKTSQIAILEELQNNLKENNIEITQESLATVYTTSLSALLKQHDIKYDMEEENITHFLLNATYNSKVQDIITDWCNKHLIPSEDEKDKAYLEDIKEKLIVTLYKENITIIKDDLYQQLPEALAKNFIKETKYREILKNTLDKYAMQPDRNNRKYIRGYRITQYQQLTQEHIALWIEDNLEKLLENNVAIKDSIIENFQNYLKKNNIKIDTEYTTAQIIDQEIQKHYQNTQKTLKLLNDTKNEYYVLLTE